MNESFESEDEYTPEEEVMNKLSLGTENAIDQDFVDALEEKEGYLYLKGTYAHFLTRKPGIHDRYNFSVFLKTFLGLKKTAISTIMKEISLLMRKFNPPPNKNGYEAESITLSDFHPIVLPLTFKVLVPYLVHQKQLALVHNIPKVVLYQKLIDELNQTNCSIYNTLFLLKQSYEAYKVDGRAIDQYLPVSWTELQPHLIKHPTKDLWASKYNKQVENRIYRSFMIQKNYEPMDSEDFNYYDTEFGLTLNHEQKQAITDAVENRITLLQGNAGCGKSTLSMIVADVFRQRGESVLFITISAKARNLLLYKIARHFKEGHPEAQTYARWSMGRKRHDNIIVDEASMIGNDQLHTLLRANPSRLILMGDAKQILPVCQVGCPFIGLQGCIKTSVLTIQNRQAADNPIVKFVQQTVDKEPVTLPEYNGESEGAFFKTSDEDDFLSFYTGFYGKVKDFFCIKSKHYQLLSDRLQETIQKDKYPIRERPYGPFRKIYLDDPVMRVTATKLAIKGTRIPVEVTNGTFGIKTLTGVIYTQKHDGVPIEEPTNYLFHEFQLAYAQSAHKTQGSEYNVVLVALHDKNPFLREGDKNIFYTSITRSKKLLILCGNTRDRKHVIQIMTSEFARPIHTYDIPMDVDPKYSRVYIRQHTITEYPVPNFLPRSSSPFDKAVCQVELVDDTYLCKCGVRLKKSSMKAHEQTKKHKAFKIDF